MSSKPQTQQATAKPKPIEKFNIGTVQVSVWRNEAGDGSVFFKATVENSYKDGDRWEQTTSYGSRDLVNLAKAALQAHSALLKLNRAQQPTGSGQPAEDDSTGE